MSQEISVLPQKETAMAVYSAANGLDPYLAQIRCEIDNFLPDVTTKKGRDAIASIAYKVAKSKTALDNMGKDLVAELKDVPKKIDAERKRMRDILDAWKDEVRQPLTDFEAAEEARIARHESEIDLIVNYRLSEWASSEQVSAVISSLQALDTGERFEEFELQATKQLAETISTLKVVQSLLEKREFEQAELSRLRAEAAEREQKDREERIAREAAENARIAAEKLAAAERQKVADDQARKDAESKAAIERAEREKLESENAFLRMKQEAEQAAARAEREKLEAVETERKRQAAEQEAERLEAEARENNKAHAKRINNDAMQDFIAAGLSVELATAAVTAIAKGVIRNIAIKY
jgi:hypothetical protein